MKEGRVLRYYLGEPKSYFEVEISEYPFVTGRYQINIKGIKDFGVGVDQVGFVATKSGLEVLWRIVREALKLEDGT